jgi:hypothetical protein
MAVGVGASLLLAALVVTVLVTPEDGIGQTEPTVSSSSPKTTAATTGLDTRTEVAERLRDILRVRDQAFQGRNFRLLEDIYTLDCPCLEGDTNAIKELVSNDYTL